LTPESDSEDEGSANAAAGLLGRGHEGTSEVYELKDRCELSRPAEAGGSSSSSDEDKEDAQGSRISRRRRRASTSTAASFTLYTPDEERAVVRKFDRKLVVFVALLYMLSFLDRSSKKPFPLPVSPRPQLTLSHQT